MTRLVARMRTIASITDTTADEAAGVTIDTILIKVASRCNIDCSYCYVYKMGDSTWASMPSLMSRSTLMALADSLNRLLLDQGRPFDVVLHGGEPLLLGEKELEFTLSALREAIGPMATLCIQTNGLLITNELLDICARADATISVSLDGPPDVHNRHRRGYDGAYTQERVIGGIACLRNHRDSQRLYSGLLAVIDPHSDPSTVYHYLKKLDAPRLDFLYRDGNHSRLPPGKSSPDSIEYGSWLARLFDIYIRDPHPTPIRILDDVVKLLLGGYGAKEGIGVTDYGIVVIDTDGSITRNDTLKSAYNGADRFEPAWSVHSHSLSDIRQTSTFKNYHALQQPSSRACLNCQELSVCGGGMPAHRWSDSNGYDNPSIYCSDQLLLIQHVRNSLSSYGMA